MTDNFDIYATDLILTYEFPKRSPTGLCLILRDSSDLNCEI